MDAYWPQCGSHPAQWLAHVAQQRKLQGRRTNKEAASWSKSSEQNITLLIFEYNTFDFVINTIGPCVDAYGPQYVDPY